ncbi:hypothetical protein [Thomasclavelia spiroformis]|uniref:hypothetical protein n=1 Tax=Thomasclavelia spiroformis TaxID=29348 RepID=UPI00241C05C3|nr:hypothetical protein [Thomasclavelia spiroformis]
MFVDIYANKEITNILEEDSKYTVSVTEVQDQEKTVESLKKIAAANSVNIQKAIYRLQENGTFVIDVYIDINEPGEVLDNFVIDGKKLSDSDLEDSYLSSKNEDNSNLIGVFSLLNKENTIHLRKFSGSKKENLKGVYSFSGVKDSDQFKQIKKQINENNITLDEDYKNLSNDTLYSSKITIFLPLLIMLLVLTCIYNYIMKFKEYSVMMLNGYDTKDILIGEIKFYAIFNLVLAMITTIAWMILHLFSYEIFNYYLYIYLLVRLVIVALIVTVLESICGLLIKRVKISLCLKNEKPNKEINIISIINKEMFLYSFYIY